MIMLRRSEVWPFLLKRKGEAITIREFSEWTITPRSTIREIFCALVNGGYMARQEAIKGVTCKYVLTKASPFFPMIKKNGEKQEKGVRQLQLWRAICLQRYGFSVKDLVVMASTEKAVVAHETARYYAHYLHRAGYLRKDDAGRYVFDRTMNTGPLPPMITQGKEVYDQNRKEVMPWKIPMKR